MIIKGCSVVAPICLWVNCQGEVLDKVSTLYVQVQYVTFPLLEVQPLLKQVRGENVKE